MRSTACVVLVATLTALSLPACKKEAAVTPGKAAPALRKAPTAAPPPDATLGSLPPDALAVVGIQSIEKARTTLQQLSRGLGDDFDLDGALADAGLPEGFLGTAAIDPKRPLSLIVWNRKAGQGVTVILPVADPAAFRSALGARAAAGTAGNSFTLTSESGTLHGNPMGTHVVLSTDPATWQRQRAFLDQVATRFAPAAPLQAIVSTGHVLTVYGEDLEAFENEALEMLSASGMHTPLGAEYGRAVAAFYGFYLDQLRDVLGEMLKVDVRVDGEADRLRIETLVQVAEGGTLAKAVALGEKRGIASVGLLPPAAYAVFGFNLDPALFASWKKQTATLLSAMFQVPADERPAVETLIADAYDCQTGDTAVALYPTRGFALGYAGVLLLKDGDKFRSAVDRFGDLYLRWARTLIEKTGGTLPPGVDFSSWEALLKGIGRATGRFGLNVDVRTGGDVVGVEFAMDYDAMPMLMGPMKSALRKGFGDRWQLAYGFGDRIAGFALGPDGYDETAKIMKGGHEFGNAAFEASIARGAARPFVVVWFDLGAGARAFAPMLEAAGAIVPGAVPDATVQQLRNMKTGQPFAITMGGSGRTLQLVLDLPLEPIRAMRALAD